MAEILFVFGLIVVVIGAIVASAISWFSKSYGDRAEGLVFKILFVGLFGSVIALLGFFVAASSGSSWQNTKNSHSL